MILDPSQIVAGYPFVARRLRRVAICDPIAVQQACERARELAASATEEPAAIFLAFAERRRAFPFAWKAMAAIVTRAQALANGLRLDVSEDELDRLCADVLHRRVGWEETRAWFGPRTLPAT